MNKKDILNLPVHIRAEMALKAAVAKVVKQRRQQGRPLIVSRNGKAVELDPAQAELVAEEPGSYEVGPQKPDP